jgi:cytochrome c-type protein NapC
MAEQSSESASGWRKCWEMMRHPSARYSVLTLFVVGGIAGVIFWGGFNTAMEWTNRLEFCIGCHEMRNTVYEEYKKTIHYQNRTGVRAICSDCHVPREWTPKLIRKIKATNELWHKALGSIDTPEKFEAKRLELAKHEWARLKANDSLECRNCHSFTGMDVEKQKPRAKRYHELAQKNKETCIDCHKGIAHKPVHKELEDEEEEEAASTDETRRAS